MNSASSCLSVSTVTFGEAETLGRGTGNEIVTTRNATIRIGRNDFMGSSIDCGAILLFLSNRKSYNHEGHEGSRRFTKDTSTLIVLSSCNFVSFVVISRGALH